MTDTTPLATDEDMTAIAMIVKDAKVAFLTTMSANGHHHSRPLAVQQHEFTGELWFFTQDPSDKVDDIRRHPQVNAAFQSGKGFLSIAGTAEIVRDSARVEEYWSPAVEAWFRRARPTRPSLCSGYDPSRPSTGTRPTPASCRHSRWSRQSSPATGRMSARTAPSNSECPTPPWHVRERPRDRQRQVSRTQCRSGRTPYPSASPPPACREDGDRRRNRLVRRAPAAERRRVFVLCAAWRAHRHDADPDGVSPFDRPDHSRPRARRRPGMGGHPLATPRGGERRPRGGDSASLSPASVALGAGSDYVPIAALFVLVVGGANPDEFSIGYLAQMGVGMLVGIVINVAVFPPLWLRESSESLASLRGRLADLLGELARSLGDATFERGTALDRIDDLERAVREAAPARVGCRGESAFQCPCAPPSP
jgi:general stress protein 26